MTDEERVRQLLRSAFPPVHDERPARDLWPLVAARIDGADRRAPWLWLDVGLAAAVGVALFIFPEWLLLLLYHL
jgi:hypothetical protein